MTISGKTPVYGIPYVFPTDSPPDMAALSQAMAERIEALLAKGGDISIAADGTITIGAEKVDATRITKALKPSGTAAAGTEALRALGATASTAAAGNDSRLSDERTPLDGTATSRKAKLTSGIDYGEGTKKAPVIYEDVPGLSITLTPAVKSNLLVIANFAFTSENKTNVEGSISLDGAAEQTPLAMLYPAEIATPIAANVMQSYYLSLTAAEHTIKARFKCGSTGLGSVNAARSSLLYLLIAA